MSHAPVVNAFLYVCCLKMCWHRHTSFDSRVDYRMLSVQRQFSLVTKGDKLRSLRHIIRFFTNMH